MTCCILHTSKLVMEFCRQWQLPEVAVWLYLQNTVRCCSLMSFATSGIFVLHTHTYNPPLHPPPHTHTSILHAKQCFYTICTFCSMVIIMLLYVVCNILLNNTNNLHINLTTPSENPSGGCNERKVPFRLSPAISVRTSSVHWRLGTDMIQN